MIHIAPGIDLEERELGERFVRASGPGGQNVNKVATAVELRFNVKASSLPADVKQRLITLAGTRITMDGVLLIDSREHRTQAQNRLSARGRLITLIKQALVKPRKRRKTKPGKTAVEKRLTSKKLHAEKKAHRATYAPGDE